MYQDRMYRYVIVPPFCRPAWGTPSFLFCFVNRRDMRGFLASSLRWLRLHLWGDTRRIGSWFDVEGGKARQIEYSEGEHSKWIDRQFFFFFYTSGIFFFILFYSQGRTTVWIDPPFWFPSPLFSPLLTRSAPYLHPTPPFPVPLPPFLFPAIGSHSTHDTISRPRDKNKEDIQSVLTTRPSQISLAPSSKHFELTRYIFSQTYHERRIYEYT